MNAILVVDDEPDIRQLMRFPLEREGYQVMEAADGQEALKLIAQGGIQLMILDLMMPNLDGFSLLELLQQQDLASKQPLPVIILSARGAEEDRIRGLSLGADDFLTKPFSPKEITLRVNNLLARLESASLSGVLSLGRLILDFRQMAFFIDQERYDLTSTEFKLMRELMRKKEQIVSREELLTEVWGYSDRMMTRTLDTHIKRLREKLGADSYLIETIRGEGYLLRKPEATAAAR